MDAVPLGVGRLGAIAAWKKKMVHPPNSCHGIANASRDTGPKNGDQANVGIAANFMLALNDVDGLDSAGAWVVVSRQ
jgi:hypothetical protein